jgi:hypothetical protein
MKHVLILLFILFSISGFSQNLNTVLTNGNTSTLPINLSAYTPNGYGLNVGNTFIQHMANGNAFILDNMVYSSTNFNFTYQASGYGSAIQFYNGGIYISGYPFQASGATVSTPAYVFGFDNNGNTYFGKNYNPSTAKGWAFGVLNDGSFHMHTPATGSNSLNALVFDPSDSSIKQVAFPSGGSGTSGTYTSTLTNTTNISSSTFLNCIYTKVGSVVTATYSVQITPVSCGVSTVLTFTLPFTTSTGSGDIGTASIAVNGGTSQYVTGQVRRLNSTQAQLFFISGTGAGCSSTSEVCFTIQYIP